MWSNFQFVNIRTILNKVLRHPLLQDLNLDAALQYTLEFIGCMGLPAVYTDEMASIKIEDHRGILPCNLVSVIQVRRKDSQICLRSMTDTFLQDDKADMTYKIQNSVIFTSFKEGEIEISYKGIPLDEEGFPMIPDNEIFLKALELYIKKEWFTILFDQQKISQQVLYNTEQQYAFKVGQCHNEFIMPSISEMESISNMLNQLVPRVNEFTRGFRTLGGRELIKLQ